MKNATKMIFAAACALAIATPAFAQSSNYGHRAGVQTHRPYAAAATRAGNAYDMQARFGNEINSENPAQTGGGSVGYNQKLLQD